MFAFPPNCHKPHRAHAPRAERERQSAAAREYTDTLAAHLGSKRVRIIAEAFRPKEGGGFRAATPEELAPQLEAYHGYRVYRLRRAALHVAGARRWTSAAVEASRAVGAGALGSPGIRFF